MSCVTWVCTVPHMQNKRETSEASAEFSRNIRVLWQFCVLSLNDSMTGPVGLRCPIRMRRLALRHLLKRKTAFANSCYMFSQK
jgi:hypothetical protein